MARAPSRCRSSFGLGGLVGAGFFAYHAPQDVFEVFLFDRCLERLVDEGLVATPAGAGTEIFNDRRIQVHGETDFSARGSVLCGRRAWQSMASAFADFAACASWFYGAFAHRAQCAYNYAYSQAAVAQTSRLRDKPAAMRVRDTVKLNRCFSQGWTCPQIRSSWREPSLV